MTYRASSAESISRSTSTETPTPLALRKSFSGLDSALILMLASCWNNWRIICMNDFLLPPTNMSRLDRRVAGLGPVSLWITPPEGKVSTSDVSPPFMGEVSCTYDGHVRIHSVVGRDSRWKQSKIFETSVSIRFREEGQSLHSLLGHVVLERHRSLRRLFYYHRITRLLVSLPRESIFRFRNKPAPSQIAVTGSFIHIHIALVTMKSDP